MAKAEKYAFEFSEAHTDRISSITVFINMLETFFGEITLNENDGHVKIDARIDVKLRQRDFFLPFLLSFLLVLFWFCYCFERQHLYSFLFLDIAV